MQFSTVATVVSPIASVTAFAAAEIGIAEVTAKVHRHNLMNKLGAKTLPDLVRMADMLEISRPK